MQSLPSPSFMVGSTVHERVRASLRQAIGNGDLLPGQRLHQGQIAATLKVSVTPVREALRDLAAEGLVQFDANRGAVVTTIGLDDFLEIRRLIEVLEPLAARMVAERITQEELHVLAKMQDQIEARPGDYLELNRAFHDQLNAAAKAPRLTAIIHSLKSTTNVVLKAGIGAVPERVEQGIQEHRPILEALAAHDPDAAAEATTAHLTPTWDAVELLVRQAAG